MHKTVKSLTLQHFLKKQKDLELLIPAKWFANTCVIPYNNYDGCPVSVRYGFKEKKFLEINVISEDNQLEYVKL